MKIVADEGIPYIEQVFGGLACDIECAAGRSINAKMLKNADILLVRSVTKVGAELLNASNVRFVGTATIGKDHIDEPYLKQRGIAFAAAAGANANSVAEYVLAAILEMAKRQETSLSGKTVGIVGLGAIGSIVAKNAKAIGLNVLANDPPLQNATGKGDFVELAEALSCDIVSLHVPLTSEGPYATYHLLGQEAFDKLNPQAILINTSRGAVVDTAELKKRLLSGSIGPVVLDVWESEPTIDAELLEHVSIGTPHIAGYSLDGKVNGTAMLYRALCDFLARPCSLDTDRLLPEPAVPQIDLAVEGFSSSPSPSDQYLATQAVRRVYDIMADDGRLRRMLDVTPQDRAGYFDALRRGYPVRREFFNTRVSLPAGCDLLADRLGKLGFRAEQTDCGPGQ